MRDYLIKAFCSNTGQSFARLITVPIVAFVLGWDTAFLKMMHAIPDGATLAGQAAFMTAFYAVNKGANAFLPKQGDSDSK